jgi:tRNA dimethylallyltransferase
MIGRGVLPVLVGGTGLYLEAIRRPLRFASVQADAKLRASLDQLSDGALRGRLIEVDPITAKRLPTGDRRRAIRALEIAALTGKPMSEQADSAEERFNLCTVGLTMQRGALIERIQARAEKMFANGLPEEVSFLVKCGLPPNAQSMQAIGYKETVRMLRGEITRVEAIEAVSVATRQYAKRQMTWFRATPDITWFDRTGCTSITKYYKDIIKSVKIRRLAIKAEGSALL